MVNWDGEGRLGGENDWDYGRLAFFRRRYLVADCKFRIVATRGFAWGSDELAAKVVRGMGARFAGIVLAD